MHDVSPGLQIQEWIGDNKQDIYLVSVQLIDPAVAQVWITQLCEHFLTCLWPAIKPHSRAHTPTTAHCNHTVDCRLVSEVVANGTCTCLFARVAVMPYLSNITTGAAHIVPFQTKKAIAPVDSSSAGRSAVVRSSSSVVGGAISFCVNETALCFLNLYFDPSNASHTWHQQCLTLPGDQDIDLAFDYVFVCGRPWQDDNSSLNQCTWGNWVSVLPDDIRSHIVYRPITEAKSIVHFTTNYVAATPKFVVLLPSALVQSKAKQHCDTCGGGEQTGWP